MIFKRFNVAVKLFHAFEFASTFVSFQRDIQKSRKAWARPLIYILKGQAISYLHFWIDPSLEWWYYLNRNSEHRWMYRSIAILNCQFFVIRDFIFPQKCYGQYLKHTGDRLSQLSRTSVLIWPGILCPRILIDSQLPVSVKVRGFNLSVRESVIKGQTLFMSEFLTQSKSRPKNRLRTVRAHTVPRSLWNVT